MSNLFFHYFQVGLRDFLHKHLYATAKASDILDALNTIYAQVCKTKDWLKQHIMSFFLPKLQLTYQNKLMQPSLNSIATERRF